MVPSLLLLAFVAQPTHGDAAPVLRAADVRMILTSPTSCDVTMQFTIDDAAEIDHRVDGSSGAIQLLDVQGARAVADPVTIGRTRSLVLRPDRATYSLHYRAQMEAAGMSRCPLWLPAVPTDGRSRAIALGIDLPPGSTSFASMPAFVWTGAHGTATLGHLPAFVQVSFGSGDAGRPWDIGRSMDVLTLVVITGATLIWAWRWRR